MQSDLTIPASFVLSFLLVLVRIGSVMVFVPLPGINSGPSVARVVLAIGSSLALYSSWPAVPANVTLSQLVAWVLSEAVMGITAGVAVSFIAEAFIMGAQILSLQAGYGYASTIDPTTQADSTILQIVAQLFAGMLFFAVGLDRIVLATFARSLDAYPPGSFSLSRPLAMELIRLGSSIFSVGLRLALPIVGLLLMVDLALALLGRINAHVQITVLSFPLKMMLTLVFLGAMLSLFPSVYQQTASRIVSFIQMAIVAH
jgi:flagellar biosynthetic protein FliR